MRLELFALTDSSLKTQSSIQYLYELKSYANSKDIHPLVTLILLSDVDQNILKQDIAEDPDFYNYLKVNLNTFYGDALYAAQFEELLTALSKKETLLELENLKYTVYGLIAICLLLLSVIVFLIYKLKQAKAGVKQQANVNLTNQEERVAELIVQEKSNKEIASELFISLSTVKTHIRNLYAKLEVSNRQEFVEKIKNQPRD
jgi:DNA-binding NarL/FixJ family response regulator